MTTHRPRLDPETAQIRRAVRESLVQASARGVVHDASTVLVALSGGPDSLALAAATAFEAPRHGLRAGAVIVDHGLQQGSAEVAAAAATQANALGLDPVVVTRVDVGTSGGPEAAARTARYSALEDAAATVPSALILLGHTLDDQAEGVLLGLARGSGPDSLAGMRRLQVRESGVAYARPLLGVRRSATRASCAALGVAPWDDPQNTDPAYLRVRVRSRLMPALERELGAGVPEALARTADQLREDAAALDHFAEELAEELSEHAEAGIALSVVGLAANPAALRQRIVRLAAEAEFGVTLSRRQTLEVCRLVTDWSGQGPIDLPGMQARRADDRIIMQAIAHGGPLDAR